MSALQSFSSHSTLVGCPGPAPQQRPDLHSRPFASERYRVGCLLGWGGMGLVYEATHVVLDAPVALKVLRPELFDCEDRVAGFLNEARWLAALSSDHIVRFLDAGQFETGLPFLVMERLEGRDLSCVVQACGQLAPAVAVEYALQACRALSEAHQLGLVHCDVKPSNLFLAARRVGPARIKLLDFGIARAVAESKADLPGVATDLRLGSPLYSSPEQQQEPWGVDCRADIWSLGLVLFELLTGVCPFAACSVAETQSRVLQERAPNVLELRPEIEPLLASAVERCLRKDRNGRFSSMRELAAALKPFST